MNPLGRLTQVDHMGEFQEELGFPPAPKLNVFGKLEPSQATAAELRGQDVFFGKGQCGVCHPAPYYTDNMMHDLKTERFFKPEMINGLNETRRRSHQDLPAAAAPHAAIPAASREPPSKAAFAPVSRCLRREPRGCVLPDLAVSLRAELESLLRRCSSEYHGRLL
jgi:hypothetical protein